MMVHVCDVARLGSENMRLYIGSRLLERGNEVLQVFVVGYMIVLSGRELCDRRDMSNLKRE
jgi:hypothetical protein